MTAYLAAAADGLAIGLLLFVVAAGLALTLGAGGILNLAHGGCYLLGAWLAWQYTDATLPGLATATVLAVLAGICAGLLVTLLTLPLTRRGHLSQALATLGLAMIAADVLAVATGGQTLPPATPSPLAGSVTIGDLTYPIYRAMFVAIGLLWAVGLWWLVDRTRAGAMIRAAAADPQMLQAVGIPPRRLLVAVITTGSILATAAGSLAAPVLPAGPGVDEHILVLSLIVVVVGGLRSMPAILVAALLIGQVETLGVALAPEAAGLTLLIIMLAVLTWRSRRVDHAWSIP
jgi:branched-chain amino acid transport system permease protein